MDKLLDKINQIDSISKVRMILKESLKSLGKQLTNNDCYKLFKHLSNYYSTPKIRDIFLSSGIRMNDVDQAINKNVLPNLVRRRMNMWINEISLGDIILDLLNDLMFEEISTDMSFIKTLDESYVKY